MSILIKTVRVSEFRGLKNIEVELEKTTVLTGMNNIGKTFSKSITVSFGEPLIHFAGRLFYTRGSSWICVKAKEPFQVYGSTSSPRTCSVSEPDLYGGQKFGIRV